MKVAKITYQRTVSLCYNYNKIQDVVGLEIELEEGDDPKAAYGQLRDSVRKKCDECVENMAGMLANMSGNC